MTRHRAPSVAALTRRVAPATVRLADVDPAGGGWACLADLDTETPQLWLQREGAAPVRVTAHDDAVAFAAFRPGARRDPMLVYGVDRGGDENQQLYLHDAASGRTTALTATPSARHDFGAFRPDGGALAYTTNAANGVDMDVVVAPLDGGTPGRVLRGQGLRRVESWSPCGRFLAVVAEHAALHEALDLVDLETGAVHPLLGAGAPVVVRSVRFLPTGDLVLVTDAGRDRAGVGRLRAGDGRLDWWLTPEVDVDRIALGKDGRRLAAALNHQGYTTLEFHDLDSGAALRLFPLEGVGEGMRWTANGEACLATVETATTPPRPSRFELDGGRAAPLAGWPSSEPVGADPELVHVASFDGRRIPGFLYRPPRPARDPAPAVLYVHGGPESQWRPGYHGEVAAFLDRGWPVLAPNIRGSTGYGRHYAGLDDRTRRADAFADVAHLGRWLGDRDGVDAARLVLAGRSYGGFTTLAGLARSPELWRCGVDFYGMADLAAFLEETAGYRRNHRAAEYGDPVGEAALLAELSPLGRADAIRAPLFVAHGLEDPRVPPAESRRIVEALAARAHDVEHVEIAAEGHGFTKRANRVAVWRRVLSFLAARLGA